MFSVTLNLKKKSSIDYCSAKLYFIVMQKLKIWSLVLDNPSSATD